MMSLPNSDIALVLRLLIAERGPAGAARALLNSEPNLPSVSSLRRACSAAGNQKWLRFSDSDFARCLTFEMEQEASQAPFLLDWRSNGFAAPPTACLAKAGLRLFRAWGAETINGRSSIGSQKIGRWFGLVKPRDAVEAELMYNVAAMQFLEKDSLPPRDPKRPPSGDKKDASKDEEAKIDAEAKVENLIRYVSEFRAVANALMWVGPVRHGDRDMSISAQQAFIPSRVEWNVIDVGKTERISGSYRVASSASRSKYAH